MKNNVDYQVSTHISETCYPQSLMIAPWLSSSRRRERRFSCCVCLFCLLLFFQSFSYFAQLLSVNKKRFLFIASQIMTLPPNLSNQCQTQISSRSNQLQLRPHSETHFLSLKRRRKKHILDSSSFYLTFFPINVRRRSLPD